MKYIKYLALGILFGIILTKSEVISWYRIYEMFRFQSFHMYGVIGSTVLLGILGVQLIKRKKLKSIDNRDIVLEEKAFSVPKYLFGGIIFGFGWALTGACPGPLFILVGYGYIVMLVAIVAATLGTFAYGALRDKLPH